MDHKKSERGTKNLLESCKQQLAFLYYLKIDKKTYITLAVIKKFYEKFPET